MKKILTVLIIIITIVSCDRKTQNDYSWYSTPTVNNRALHNYTPRPIVNRPVQRVLPNRGLAPKRIITARSKVTTINTSSTSCRAGVQVDDSN